MNTENAAHNLLNRTLSSGWFVKEKIKKTDNQTGSFFSVCYLVEKDGETCFLKAFDFSKFLTISDPNRKVVDVMNDMLTAYRYERDLSEHCKNKYVTKVAFVKVADEEMIPGYAISIVPYLIFDLADGDVRKKLDFSKKLDYAWRLKSLHDIAIGLKQLHAVEVTHQDLKPSNVLVYLSKESKIGDLGRSICRDIDGPYNKMVFSGDNTYAPPEIMYGYYEKDWKKRVFATDCYLLGSLVTFYFSGISMSALLRKNIPHNFSWEVWNGTYEELIPYLENGFSSALDEFEENIKEYKDRVELKKLVEYLCNPFPEKRGHPKTITSIGSNFNLERFISRLDYLKRKAEIAVNN
ncbi:protein kinase domain-containing protein [Phaeodactylibacter luteus]|uniref:Protein kinase n=1 Tax=Phaeodactylibacter luteus TaxID=1564516 RepID=A0A5C6RIH9_9BACT|nr:protein kinase [Phaeodactylibacter luteus]TXB61794.1 protein kinase [Phaeodactylibacter luteus]